MKKLMKVNEKLIKLMKKKTMLLEENGKEYMGGFGGSKGEGEAL